MENEYLIYGLFKIKTKIFYKQYQKIKKWCVNLLLLDILRFFWKNLGLFIKQSPKLDKSVVIAYSNSKIMIKYINKKLFYLILMLFLKINF